MSFQRSLVFNDSTENSSHRALLVFPFLTTLFSAEFSTFLGEFSFPGIFFPRKDSFSEKRKKKSI